MVYGLGDQAGPILKERGIAPTGGHYNEKNHAVGRFFLHHSLFVSEIMVAIELACRKNGRVQLLYGEDIALPNGQLTRWNVTVNGDRLSAIPDRAFALESKGASKNRVYFFLEADWGTMPVKRSSLSKTSFHKKLLAYEATWRQNLHRSLLGINRFRVITVTTSSERVHSLIEACSKLKSGHRLFLFGDKTHLSGNMLSEGWSTGKKGEMSPLLQSQPANKILEL